MSKPLFSILFTLIIHAYKNACQLEGSDHGGRDSAAELALAGTIDVQVSDSSCNRLTLGPTPPDGHELYTREPDSQRLFQKCPGSLPCLAKTPRNSKASRVLSSTVSSLAAESFPDRLPAGAVENAVLAQRKSNQGTTAKSTDLTLSSLDSYTANSLHALAR